MQPEFITYNETRDNHVRVPDFYFPRKIKIAVVQLLSPFYDELALEEGVYNWKDSSKYYSKIEKILLYLAKKNLDIVVFPEYSIPSDKLIKIKEHSKNFKVLIAGSDICRDSNNKKLYGKNICSVFIENQCFSIEKRHLAQDEEGVENGEEGRDSLKVFCKIKDTDGNSLDTVVQIYICKDYLAAHDTENMDYGFTIIPMCSEKTETFVNYAKLDSKKRKFTILCNTVSSNCNYVGKSSIYGPNQLGFTLIEKLFAPREGLILASLNISEPYVYKFGDLFSENPVGFHDVYYFDENHEAKKISNQANNTIHNFNLVKSSCSSTCFPAAAYPEILLQLLKDKHLIKSIAFYNKDEKFWCGYWGRKLNLPNVNKENVRIFVVENETQLKELYDKVLIEHANNYHVLVINENIAKEEVKCFRDFAIIEDKGEKIFAEYFNVKEMQISEYEDYRIDIIGKKARFSLDTNEIEDKCSIFEEMRKKSVAVEKDIEFVNLKKRVFKKKGSLNSFRLMVLQVFGRSATPKSITSKLK